MERLYLVDGMAIAYRAYFAFINRPLVNSKGMNTSAVFGFVAALEKILAERPDHVAVAFDTKEPTFRHKRYPPYKATREKMPEDMVDQLPYLRKIVEAYNIPAIELPGWEADDIIGTLAKRAETRGLTCVLVTPDKDYMQLVGRNIRILRPGKSADTWDFVDEEGVVAKFGVPPERVTDVLGLIGDASDNIPGVRGIGEKTAIPLVQEFGPLEEIYRNIDRIPKAAVRAKLLEQKDAAFLSRELVTIDVNAPLRIDPHELRAKERNIAALRELFAELELRRFLLKLDEQQAGGDAARAEMPDRGHDYDTVLSRAELDAMVKEILQAREFCFDTETSGRNPLSSRLVGLSFAIRPRHAWYVPANEKLPAAEILSAVSPLFDGDRTVIGQNLKFDLLVMRQVGLVCSSRLYDTMIASYILDPEGEHSMNALARKFLGYEPIPIEALIGKGRNQKSMADVPLERVAEYSAEDADITLRIAHALRPEIEKTGQGKLLEEIEFPLIHVLVDMENTGVKIDVEALGEISKEMEAQIAGVTERIHALAGERFTIGSPKQLGTVLFEKLRLPAGKKTKTGYSTDSSVLESLQGRHPIIDEILLYRLLTKLKSTYVDALPRMVNPRTGRVHTSYNQAVAATGRLSSADPNLQNIPIRTEAGREIRRAFVAEGEDAFLLSADYSQIELRIAAEMSGDKGLIEAFARGEDIHASTAMKLFNVRREEVTPEMRRVAKTTNFGILYGISPYGLAQRLGIPNPDAKDLIDVYFRKYPDIDRYIRRTIASARENGYVETLMGRRRYLPDIRSANRNVRMLAERMAINAPIQGSAADMIKVAMISIHKELRARRMRARMILQVHDELVFETPAEELEELRALVVDRMKNAIPLRIPVEVDTGVGKNWLEAH
ncbi:MAG: DNA polymerase I [Bacteroidota bacterium]|nr:DNA polymerase I [Bacteroidota bacterium]